MEERLTKYEWTLSIEPSGLSGCGADSSSSLFLFPLTGVVRITMGPFSSTVVCPPSKSPSIASRGRT